MQLHRLLKMVNDEIREEIDLETETMDEYKQNDTKPVSLHKSKSNHKQCVFLLAHDSATLSEKNMKETPEEATEVNSLVVQ